MSGEVAGERSLLITAEEFRAALDVRTRQAREVFADQVDAEADTACGDVADVLRGIAARIRATRTAEIEELLGETEG